MRKRLLAVAAILALACAGEASFAGNELWYTKPAGAWEEALPLGNGHLGAMDFGGTLHERIQLNEDTLWEGYPIDRNNPKALAALPEIRKMIFEGNSAEATKLIGADMMGVPPRIRSYQPLGDLVMDDLTTRNGEAAPPLTDFRRSLDLQTGISTTTWTSQGTHFKREVFASHVDDVVVVNLTADQPGKINVRVSLTRSQDASATMEEPNITLRGQIKSQYVNGDKKPWGPVKDGMKFAGVAHLDHDGGTIATGSDGFTVTGADSITLRVLGATDYKHDGTLTGADPLETCMATLRKVEGKNYDDLRAAHVADVQAIMSRCELDIGHNAQQEKLPIDERLAAMKKSGEIASDPDLLSTYFQYGRYMLLASSREGSGGGGGMPANLQGIWNDKMNADWNSDYHTNINIQMNYWPAEVTNLSETTEPLFDLMQALSVPGAKTAKEEYGVDQGWVVHHLTDPFLTTTPCDQAAGMWPMGAAWMCQHLWEHYAFTQDKAFLAKTGYPLMKGASQFIIGFLVPAPAGTKFPGKLVTNPSYSPENKFYIIGNEQASFTYASTMDLEIIHDLLTHTVASAKILGVDADFAKKCEDTLAQLPPLQISADGRLQEWIEDYKEQDIHHRHTSHLFAVYPGDQITVSGTPELAAAAKKSLEVRGDEGATEWSFAWRAALWARFGDGDHALHMLDQLVSGSLYTNMFNRYGKGPFQIDGNFGATAAIPEMLLQSQGGEIQLLPALPTTWDTGHVNGLCARGGFEISESWQNHALASATIISKSGLPVKLKTDQPVSITSGGKTVDAKNDGANVLEFPTQPGATYEVHPAAR